MNSSPNLSRSRYLQLLRAAISAGSHRFARLAALDWLAAYPGDLEVGLWYAHSLAADGRAAQSATVLEGLCRADPEFVDAVEALVDLKMETSDDPSSTAATCLFALTGRSRDRRIVSSWGGSLWLGRQALVQGKLDLAEEMLRDALRQAPEEPLIQVSHLNLLRRLTHIDVQLGREIATSYHHRSPDCLPIMLHLAVWLLQSGDEDQGVALLHQAAARDIAGQAAERLWGKDHPYQVLWPERMQVELRLQIPAEVSAVLGWNRLPSQSLSVRQEAPDERRVSSPDAIGMVAGHQDILGSDLPPLHTPIEVDAGSPPGVQVDDPEATRPTKVRKSPSTRVKSALAPTGDIYWALATEDARSSSHSASVAKDRLLEIVGSEHVLKSPETARKSLDPEVVLVSKEMDRMARQLKLPVHGHLDGRYPVYVVLSLHDRLVELYGAGVAALLESEMDALCDAIAHRPGWNAMILTADDPAILRRLELSPVRSADPWEIKLLLADLDAALARRGECIGALLIVGGPEIIPYHRLPNPVDDQDPDVPSDNPYATRNENYFVPEWPVGRLPGGAEPDARLLLDGLRRIRQAHEAALVRPSLFRRIGVWLRGLLGKNRNPANLPLHPGRRLPPFGYTAAVWKAASARVFRPIGRPASMHVSPPRGFDGATPAVSDESIPQPFGRLGYFNLHGLADGPEWFGQRDPLDPAAAPDFPVAIRPEDVICAAEKSERIPRVVFSQACYGLSIQDCMPHQSMALSFLQAGSLAVIGSTGMSYGALSEQLAAGDLLAHKFWSGIQDGLPAGEALRQAKIALVSELDCTQGYLDGEEQKTLISFCLIGDPLATPDTVLRMPKSLRYQDSTLQNVVTICDKVEGESGAGTISPEVMSSVRGAVARYLPGMTDARITIAHPRSACNGAAHDCPTSRLERRSRIDHAAHQALPAVSGHKPPISGRRGINRTHSKNCRDQISRSSLVTLSKPVQLPNAEHPRIARLTLDETGKLVKLVVSR